MGINALKSGNRDVARHLLTAAIKQDPNDAVAWLWLTGTLDKDEERIACLRQVQKIDPNNQAAARGLAQIMERQASKQAQAGQPITAGEPSPQRKESDLLVSSGDWMKGSVAGAPAPVDAPEPTVTAFAEPSVPAVEAPAVSAQPARRRMFRKAVDQMIRPIFRSRPSLVPALACFWLFLIGALIIASLLGEAPEIGLPFAGGLAFILELIVLYVIVRGLAERYELTNQQLTMRFRGKRASIPIANIYSAEMNQTFLQRLIGVGNIEIEAAVNGELARLRLRNVPHCQLRTDQIQNLVKEYAAA
jgi:hypothetical protein